MTLRIRPLAAPMRTVLAGGAVFVFVAGIPLFLLSGSTERWFAWTIASPLTAAFLGSFYWAACVIAVMSATARDWALARVGVPGVSMFVVLTLIATLLHLGSFHLERDGFARVAAWGWLAVYALQPVALAVAWAWQLRLPGGDPPRERRVPRALSVALGAQGLAYSAIGAWLMVSPRGGGWPWSLTPLAGRAIAAWLLGLGIVALSAVREDDARRLRAAPAGLLALVVLQGVALLRFGDEVAWATSGGWTYALLLLAAGVTAVTGAVSMRRGPA